jgi:hypothetical protein
VFETLTLSAVTLASGDPRSAFRELSYGVLAHFPGVISAYERQRFPGRFIADSRAHLVVEGYLSSGNTWTAEVLQLANPCCRVARHQHRAAEVKEGLRHGLPVLILVRDPIDAVASILVRQPERRVRPELARYAAFYAACQPLIPRCVVATFEQVTQDIDCVVDRLNARFATSFLSLRDLGPDGPRLVRSRIEESDRIGLGDAAGRKGAVPSAERSGLLQQQRLLVRSPGNGRLLSRCIRLHSTFSRASE